MADAFNISIQNVFQGSPIPFKFNFWTTPPNPNATPPVVGVPNDISGWSFLFTWKQRFSDADPGLYQKVWTIAAGAGTSGSTSLPEIPAAITLPVPAKTLTFWDLKVIVPPSTETAPALAGTIYLNPTVTQKQTVP